MKPGSYKHKTLVIFLWILTLKKRIELISKNKKVSILAFIAQALIKTLSIMKDFLGKSNSKIKWKYMALQPKLTKINGKLCVFDGPKGKSHENASFSKKNQQTNQRKLHVNNHINIKSHEN